MKGLKIKIDELLAEDYGKLTTLLGIWTPKAEFDEVAVSAVVKLMQQREQVLTKYYNAVPDEDSKIEQFRKDREERKNKNTRKFKK